MTEITKTERTLESSLKEAKNHWKKILKAVYKIRLAGLRKGDLRFHIKTSDELIEVMFSSKMMGLISMLEIDKSGKIPLKVLKVLERHRKKTRLEPILKFYKPELLISQRGSIIISKKTGVDCPEGPFSLISCYLELLKTYLDLENQEEKEAIDYIKKKFREKNKKGAIIFKRKAGGIKIKIIIPTEGKNYRSAVLFYSATGEGIRRRLKDIFCYI